MVTNLTVSQHIAQLAQARHEAHPDETNMASWKAVHDDPANADVFSRYAQEQLGRGVTTTPPPRAIGSTPGQDGAAAARRVGGALPDDHQQLSEPVDVRYNKAVERVMSECGLSGTAGREAAGHLLANAEPELVNEYAAHLTTVKL